MSSLDWVKTAYETLKKANQLEIAEKLMGFREELLGIREKNLNLKAENDNLINQLEFKGKVKFEKGICWIENDEMSTSNSPTPICPQCYQTKNIINRLPEIEYVAGPGIKCNLCKGFFHIV